MTPTRSDWMLYGAYGGTGRLILDEALRRGHRPILAGRDSAQLSALGQATGLRTVRLQLDDSAALRAALSRVRCVLLAAGPYSLTGQPMRDACLDSGCSDPLTSICAAVNQRDRVPGTLVGRDLKDDGLGRPAP